MGGGGGDGIGENLPFTLSEFDGFWTLLALNFRL